MQNLPLVRGKTYSLKKNDITEVVEFEFMNEKTHLAMVHPLGEYDVSKWFGVKVSDLEVYSSVTVRASITEKKSKQPQPYGKSQNDGLSFKA
jgi:hypothetical protein